MNFVPSHDLQVVCLNVEDEASKMDLTLDHISKELDRCYIICENQNDEERCIFIQNLLEMKVKEFSKLCLQIRERKTGPVVMADFGNDKENVSVLKTILHCKVIANMWYLLYFFRRYRTAAIAMMLAESLDFELTHRLSNHLHLCQW